MSAWDNSLWAIQSKVSGNQKYQGFSLFAAIMRTIGFFELVGMFQLIFYPGPIPTVLFCRYSIEIYRVWLSVIVNLVKLKFSEVICISSADVVPGGVHH